MAVLVLLAAPAGAHLIAARVEAARQYGMQRVKKLSIVPEFGEDEFFVAGWTMPILRARPDLSIRRIVD
jgi:hypothetical protein